MKGQKHGQACSVVGAFARHGGTWGIVCYGF